MQAIMKDRDIHSAHSFERWRSKTCDPIAWPLRRLMDAGMPWWECVQNTLSHLQLGQKEDGDSGLLLL